MNRRQDPTHLEARHTIAVVSRRTGISQLLLRAWERRYGAVAPGRTGTGRRLYSDADIQRLQLLSRLTDHGHRIGDIATLPVAELETLAGEIVELSPRPLPLPAVTQLDELLGAALQAVADLDPTRLEGLLARASVVLSRPILRRELLQPLLVEIGERWHDGTLRIAHEHMATAVVKAFLANLTQGRAAATGAPGLVITTPAGQHHELGALMAASLALEAGWRVLYLGSDLPAEEIAMAVQKSEARAILLSLVYPGDDPAVMEQLRALRRFVGDGLPILVGGQAAQSYLTTLVGINARLLDNLDDLDRELSLLR
ncbi:MAG: MerR family transcriptional regulator [Krumholzibacteria bacterium]|nr:MerR family transcriptional regulator [Candidatus Krumholzibacteria bacterium]